MSHWKVAAELCFRRRLVFIFFCAWLSGTLLLTLLPTGDAVPRLSLTLLTVGRGTHYSADFILNWMLFLPGGVLATVAFGAIRGVGLTVCVTVLVETLQAGIPGRHPSLFDLLANALGALSGAILVRRSLGPRSQQLLAGLVGLVWLAPLVLLIPKTSVSDHLFGFWTPSFGHVPHYEGKVLDASVGGLSVESRIVPNKGALDAAIRERRPVRLRLIVGPAPPRLAPVFQISDRTGDILMLGALRSDLVLRGRNLASVMGLDQPDVRWPEAMQGRPVGDTVLVVVERARDSGCMSVGRAERCGLAPSLAEGWGHLMYPEDAPEWLRTILSILWALGLGGILGGTLSEERLALAAAAVLAAVGFVASRVSPDVRPDLLGSTMFIVGSYVGMVLRRPVLRLWSWIRTARPAGPPRRSRST